MKIFDGDAESLQDRELEEDTRRHRGRTYKRDLRETEDVRRRKADEEGI